MPISRRTSHRIQGGALVPVLLLTLLLGGALGLNYYRNYQIDVKEERTSRPFARYGLGDLAIMAEGYRMELSEAQKRHRGARVKTRERQFFTDKVEEFERVQREARKARDRAIDVAEIQSNIDAIEAEQRRRRGGNADLMRHVTLMFRI